MGKYSERPQRVYVPIETLFDVADVTPSSKHARENDDTGEWEWVEIRTSDGKGSVNFSDTDVVGKYDISFAYDFGNTPRARQAAQQSIFRILRDLGDRRYSSASQVPVEYHGNSDDGLWESGLECSGINAQKIARASQRFASGYKIGDQSIDDILDAAGIPPEAIESNEGLWNFIQRVERNEVVSKNSSFFVTDKQGEEWMLTVYDDERRARIAAAANYYLAPHLDIVVPGKSPEPIEANGMYLTLQKRQPKELNVQRPLEYWISSLALFHREVKGIFESNGIVLPSASFRSIDHEVERYERGKKNNSLKFDVGKFHAAMQYLQETQYRTAIHNDPKPANLFGPFLVDLEHVSLGSPAIDLAVLFMQYGVAQENWEHHLRTYLDVKGVSGSYDSELAELLEAMEYAKDYRATKGIISTSLKPMTPENQEYSGRFLAYS